MTGTNFIIHYIGSSLLILGIVGIFMGANTVTDAIILFGVRPRHSDTQVESIRRYIVNRKRNATRNSICP